jgi:hypothetical protein
MVPVYPYPAGNSFVVSRVYEYDYHSYYTTEVETPARGRPSGCGETLRKSMWMQRGLRPGGLSP